MSEYGWVVNNADGVRIIDYRNRNFEVITYGDITITGAGDIHNISWPYCECPRVFLKAVPAAYMYRQPVFYSSGAWSSSINVTADRATTLSYFVAGFSVDQSFQGYGVGVKDEQGRVVFETRRRYLRMSRPPSAYQLVYNNAPNERIWESISWNNGFVTYPAIAATNDSYFEFGALEAYAHNGFNHWYLGFGRNASNPLQISVARRSDAISWNSTYGIGAWQPSSDGVMNPRLVFCEDFTP